MIVDGFAMENLGYPSASGVESLEELFETLPTLEGSFRVMVIGNGFFNGLGDEAV